MSSFKEKLSKSGKSVLDERAQNLYDLVLIDEEAFINAKRAAVARLKGELAKHSDVAVTSTHSLVPGGKDFDSKAWVEKRHALALQLRRALIELKVAQEVHDEEFPSGGSDSIDTSNINTLE